MRRRSESGAGALSPYLGPARCGLPLARAVTSVEHLAHFQHVNKPMNIPFIYFDTGCLWQLWKSPRRANAEGVLAAVRNFPELQRAATEKQLRKHTRFEHSWPQEERWDCHL